MHSYAGKSEQSATHTFLAAWWQYRSAFTAVCMAESSVRVAASVRWCIADMPHQLAQFGIILVAM